MRKTVFSWVAGALGLAVLLAAGASAQDVKLPQSLTFTAYDTGSSGFNITVAVGKALKQKYGIDVRVLPAGNDVARLAPVKTGRAQASAMGTGTYFAQEGVFEFASKDWGPQPLRLLLTSVACNSLSLGVAKDAGVKQIQDLKGKRVGFVVGAPALNQGALGILSLGGLTAKDVHIVEFSSYGAMWKGMINNEIDAAFGSTISGQAREMDASPRGLMYPPAPASDAAAWARIAKIAPYFYPHKTTCGAGGISKDNPIELPAYPYPIYMAYASQSADLVYNLTKAMIANYDAYKNDVPGADGLELSRQILTWVVPYHEGTVRAMKEAGIWTDEAQRHNDALIARQNALAEAWAGFMKTSPPDDPAAFTKAWLAARKTALEKAGMDVIFE